MTRPCDSLSDPFDRNLCRRLADEKLIDEVQLDSGYESFRIDGDRFVRDVRGSGDFRIAPELYDRAIPLAETRREVWELLKEGRPVPWSRFQLEGAEGERLRQWIQSFGTAEKLFAGLTAPVDKGGLGLVFDTEESGPARTPLDVYRDRKANCIEFVAFFLMAADRLGIPAVPVEVFRDADGKFIEHVRIGFQDPKTGAVTHTADLATGRFAETSVRECWTALSRREFFSYFQNLKAVRTQDPRTAEAEVDFALNINPRNYVSLYNKAYYAGHRGKTTQALSYLLRSIEAYPRYPLAYWNLRIVADRLGEDEVAQWALARYRELFTDRP